MTTQIASGTRLGPYEIVSRIGAGGMGEVWRARDSQIGRDVAIKVLPVSAAENADRLHRFELEARAAGTLNHPNLVTIFELGKHDGAPFIVMELLEGETLREKIDEGTIPPRKAIEYAVQMADGLAAAHDKGIIHRDLKPENVIVTADGRLKILDFGLAKLTRPEEASDDKTARRDTSPGTVMGTAGYMSPEQVRGQQVDHRTDIFSFGAILYEMVSGRRAFTRDSSVETMNAILKEDPPEMKASGPHGSLATERIIHRCLEKSAAERFQSARDLSFALDSLSSSSSGHESAIQAAPIPSGRKLSMALAAVAAAALMALLFFVGRSSRPQQQPSVRQLTFRNGTIRSARFAPDGQTIVYGAAWDGAPLKMFQRRLQGSESVPLQFPDADLLGISSKGELAISLGRTFEYWRTSGDLAKAPLLGSSFRKVLDGVSWADWHPSGDGLLVVRRVGNEDRLEYPIGKVLYRTAGFITYPRFSPKGDRVAFLDHPVYGDNRGNVSLLTLGGKKSDMLLDWSGLEGLAWSPGGGEVWFTGARVNGAWSIYAVHEGAEPRPVWRTPSNLILHDVDHLGRVLVANAAIVSTIRGLGRGEQRERDLSFGGWSAVRDISADGKNALLVNYGGDASRYYDTYLRPLNGAAPTRLGEGEPRGFSRDGKSVLALIISTQQKLFLYGTESESSQAIGNLSPVERTAALLPDGRRMLLIESVKPGSVDCYVQEIDSGKRSRLPIEHAPAGLPLVSPDGLAVAIVKGNAATSVYSLTGQFLREVPVSYRPLGWSSDSRFLYVRSPGEIPVRIQRLEVATGIATPWKEIVSVDTSGMAGPIEVSINSDGDAYTYTVTKMITDLFIVEGLR